MAGIVTENIVEHLGNRRLHFCNAPKASGAHIYLSD